MADEKKPITRAYQDEKGRFTTGNKAAVGAKHNRIVKKDAEQLLSLLDEEFPDSEMPAMLRHIWEVAMATGSGKVMLAVWQEIADRKYGKAVGRQINLDGTLEEFIQVMKGRAGSEDVEEVVDVETYTRQDVTNRLMDTGAARGSLRNGEDNLLDEEDRELVE